MQHPAFTAGALAVVTGAASGIGRAAARRLLSMGMRVAFVDLDGPALDEALEVSPPAGQPAHGGAQRVALDLADTDAAAATFETLTARHGAPSVLLNAAVVRDGGGAFTDVQTWQRAFAVNLWGIVAAVQAFAPAMSAAGRPGVIINAGSKQGITSPPGNLTYNVAKAALKSYTEGLAHELRTDHGSTVTAHLLIPGLTNTAPARDKPGAWSADQVIDAMLAGVASGDFYILCPDNEVTLEMDRKRILWAAGDVADNRPALSRWHPDYAAAFAAFEPPPGGGNS